MTKMEQVSERSYTVKAATEEYARASGVKWAGWGPESDEVRVVSSATPDEGVWDVTVTRWAERRKTARYGG